MHVKRDLVSVLMEYGQTREVKVTFRDMERSGPHHASRFVYLDMLVSVFRQTSNFTLYYCKGQIKQVKDPFHVSGQRHVGHLLLATLT